MMNKILSPFLSVVPFSPHYSPTRKNKRKKKYATSTPPNAIVGAARSSLRHLHRRTHKKRKKKKRKTSVREIKDAETNKMERSSLLLERVDEEMREEEEISALCTCEEERCCTFLKLTRTITYL